MKNINPSIWTAILVILSTAMLAINYDIVEVKGIGLSFNLLSISEINVKKPEVFLVIVVMVIILACFFHVREFLHNFLSLFVEEYRSNKKLVCHIKEIVAGVVGHNACGAPTACIDPGVFNKQINLGRYIQKNGLLSEEQIIMLPNSLHRSCFVLALIKSSFSKYSFFALAPVVIGLWSVAKIVI